MDRHDDNNYGEIGDKRALEKAIIFIQKLGAKGRGSAGLTSGTAMGSQQDNSSSADSDLDGDNSLPADSDSDEALDNSSLADPNSNASSLSGPSPEQREMSTLSMERAPIAPSRYAAKLYRGCRVAVWFKHEGEFFEANVTGKAGDLVGLKYPDDGMIEWLRLEDDYHNFKILSWG